MVVIYEVNLSVNNEIISAFEGWLMPHITAMLQLKGFQSAKVLTQNSEEDQNLPSDQTHLTVQYQVESREVLQDYFDCHSQSMREDGGRRFGGKFISTRRILYQH